MKTIKVEKLQNYNYDIRQEVKQKSKDKHRDHDRAPHIKGRIPKQTKFQEGSGVEADQGEGRRARFMEKKQDWTLRRIRKPGQSRQSRWPGQSRQSR